MKNETLSVFLLKMFVNLLKILLKFCTLPLSLLSVFYCKIAYINPDAHYFVLNKKTGLLNDNRSSFIRNKLGSKNLKMVYCANDLDFIKNYIKIFPAVNIRTFLCTNTESISHDFGRPFFVYKFKHFYSVLLSMLKINTYYIMDDPRTWVANIKICRNNNWKSYGYMHGRFNEFHHEIFKITPDYYLVWNDYFRNLYKLCALDIAECKFVLIDEFFPSTKPPYRCLQDDKENYKALVVSDDYYTVEDILKNAVFTNGKNVTVLERPKYYVESAKKRGSSQRLSFRDTLEINQIDFVVGSLSTCLIEAEYFGSVSVAIPSDVPYGSHILRDKLAIPVNFFNQLTRNNELCLSTKALEQLQIRNNQTAEFYG